MSVVQTGKKLGGNKRVCEFRPQIIDDQQVAVTDVIGDTGCRLRALPVKSTPGQDIKKLGSAEVDHQVSLVDQFLCDTAGQKRFTRSYCTIKKQVSVVLIEAFYEILAYLYSFCKFFKILSRIIIIRK